ncbi:MULTISPECIES: hypothetical protein [Enterobacterales]|uniref:Uncharacterized protein n=2 Tax=Klebsiella TaxID=570 RepID=A0A0J2GRF4_9ENTR|nr:MULTISPECIES: hypothetical protein [Enterobacterales]EKP1131801.1 hypothetical protein [Klebsiella michiganensis]EKU3005209.1 hypothetical protein [Klebsiella pneumoniae]EKW3531155.1 hypothetical protein [Raoultella planticola]ELB6487720.1 hypothetical protein [Raoultella ornithinolytica]ELJ6259520.1 hypothetical protein [Klebsiella michiganensis]
MSARQLKLIISLCVIVFVGSIFSPIYENYLDSQPATPEQLHTIIRETPCAGKVLLLALDVNDGNSSEPLTLGYANELASGCKEKEMLMESKKIREGEMTTFREKQLKALNGINK